ncbi:MAG: BamA/TamA family outer membrane protein [Bacteroidetes bacterium]|nr:BamA/TamA family outer membrane protein [Bacteroidota bacterium]
MANMKRFFLVGVLVLLAAPVSLQAQKLTASEKPPAYKAERQLIETTLQTIVAVMQEATMQREGSGLGNRLREITKRLSRAATLMTPSSNATGATAREDLDDLRRMLLDIGKQLEAVREELEDQDLADRMLDIEGDLRQALREVDRLSDQEERGVVKPEDGERWLRPGRHRNRHARRDDERERRDEDRRTDLEVDLDLEIGEEIQREIEEARDDWEDNRDRRHHRQKRSDFDWHSYTGTFVGEYSYRWPYRRETALYRSIPAIRYNRVEGVVLGIGRRALEWSSYSRATVYGQAGYAFSLDKWRATIGIETRLDNRRNSDYGLKIGGAYRFNTDTKDRWKTSWLENSLAAFFFENDFFDYHEVEGWTLYAVQRITPYVQMSAGYRDEDYRSLRKHTGWSLFDGDGFASNPPIDEGQMQSFVFAVEGGRVRGLHSLPSGAAFRFEAEIGEGLGGDFAFNRYVGDARFYIPITPFSSLGLRLRGGLTTGDFVPLQKQFTLGGIGSVRAYDQNSFPGTRMLLGNVEYIVDDIDLLGFADDLQLIGFADLGWVNAFGANEFDFDDVIPSAGFGIGLDDRDVRLELAFPLRDFGGNQNPSLWLRITPSF